MAHGERIGGMIDGLVGGTIDAAWRRESCRTARAVRASPVVIAAAFAASVLTPLSAAAAMPGAVVGSDAPVASSGVASQPATTPPTTDVIAERPRTMDDLSAEFEKIRAANKIPSLAGAIVTIDGVIALGASGLRADGRPEPVTPGDRYHLGSCTKAMTATLIGILVEKGVLKWETTLAEALPSLKDSMHADYRTVTVTDLLTQRTGVPAELDRDGAWAQLWKNEGTLIEQRAGCVKTVMAWGPSHERAKFEYSNTNFIIAGHVAEVATGKSWEELTRELLFEPLGMSSAGFGAPGEAGKFDQPQGHHEDGTPVGVGLGSDNPAALGPAGTVHASMEDWGKFIALHLRGARAAETGGSVKVGEVAISGETFRRMHTAVTGNGGDYAMGWVVARRHWGKGPPIDGKPGDSTVLNHAGSNTMWFAVTWLAPNRGFAVLSATNSASEAAMKATDAAAGMMIQKHVAALK
jgi:CubicO group peptidase (beta-lactamase class C family)